jgi:hypothetical protein
LSSATSSGTGICRPGCFTAAARSISKDPGPEGPALVHPGRVMWLISFTGSVQVSG